MDTHRDHPRLPDEEPLDIIACPRFKSFDLQLGTTNPTLSFGEGICYKPSSPALQSFISRPHSDFRTWEAVMRREGLGSNIE